jgi:hypothetical protein
MRGKAERPAARSAASNAQKTKCQNQTKRSPAQGAVRQCRWFRAASSVSSYFPERDGTLTGAALCGCCQITQRTEEWNIGGPPSSTAGR